MISSSYFSSLIKVLLEAFLDDIATDDFHRGQLVRRQECVLGRECLAEDYVHEECAEKAIVPDQVFRVFGHQLGVYPEPL